MVEHLTEAHRFVITDNQQTCVLDYTLSGDTVNFTHTFVPVALRGKGYAEQLVKTGFAWADSQGLQKKASCWYAAKFL